MAIVRMDHVVVVVSDLEAAIAFFTELGMDVEARMDGLSGDWIDRVNAISGLDVDIVMMVTPDGHGKLELTRFRAPEVVDHGAEPANVAGYRSVMFAVDDVDGTVERLRTHGGELIGDIVDYEGVYRLCYVRGPAGIIVALAEELGGS